MGQVQRSELSPEMLTVDVFFQFVTIICIYIGKCNIKLGCGNFTVQSSLKLSTFIRFEFLILQI